jgi:hypothetical protein
MDQFRLAASAEKLEKLLLQYAATDAEVGGLQKALSGLINDARAGKIAAPLEWRDVPGTHSFTEGYLRKYGDLEAAHADFKIEVTGGESPMLRALRLNG